MPAGKCVSIGPKKQINASPSKNQSPLVAILFRASRCQASLNNELLSSATSDKAVIGSLAGKVSMSLKLQLGIQPNLHHIHEQIEEDNQRRVKQYRADDQRVIAIRN